MKMEAATDVSIGLAMRHSFRPFGTSDTRVGTRFHVLQRVPWARAHGYNLPPRCG